MRVGVLQLVQSDQANEYSAGSKLSPLIWSNTNCPSHSFVLLVGLTEKLPIAKGVGVGALSWALAVAAQPVTKSVTMIW